MSDPCKALIAQGVGGHAGCVLQYTGAALDNEIHECGHYRLDDLGLDDAPEGLSVWEGTFHYTQDRQTGEWDFDEARGAFRPLWPDEWRRLATGETLFAVAVPE